MRSIGTMLLISLVLATQACADRAESATPRRSEVPSPAPAAAEFTVDTATVEVPLELPAQLYVEHDATIVARSQGTVDSILVELGDHVTAGQLLARLESAEQEIALAAADAAYENLVRVVGRARALTKSGGVTPADSERVELELRQAEIARRKARHDLERTTITAPFDGAVTARFIHPNRFVSVGDSLFRITEPAPLLARVRVPQASAQSVVVGASATVVSSTGRTAPAVVAHAAAIIDAASGTREVVLRIAKPSTDLVVGAAVTVQLGHTRRNVAVVSRDAIAPDGYVLVVENGRSTVRAVTTGALLDGGRVEVRSGLSPGERLARPAR